MEKTVDSRGCLASAISIPVTAAALLVMTMLYIALLALQVFVSCVELLICWPEFLYKLFSERKDE